MTLIEVLLTLGILSLLAALTLGGVQRVRASAARVECQSRMRQLGLAVQNYHAVERRYPEGVSYPFSRTEAQIETEHSGLSWLTLLLPHVEQDGVYRDIIALHRREPKGDSVAHVALASVRIPTFRCPADPRPQGQSGSNPSWNWALTNFIGVAGTGLRTDDGILHPALAGSSAGVTDGTSNTLLFGERPTPPKGIGAAWYSDWGALRYFPGQVMPINEKRANTYEPPGPACPTVSVFEPGQYDSPCHSYHFWSLHAGGANFGFADGSVRFLRYSAVGVLPALATKAGGETAAVPD